MSDSPIKTERRGHVLEVTLDRPKANAIDLATSRIMGDVFRDFRDDPELRVAILTGGAAAQCPCWPIKRVHHVCYIVTRHTGTLTIHPDLFKFSLFILPMVKKGRLVVQMLAGPGL